MRALFSLVILFLMASCSSAVRFSSAGTTNEIPAQGEKIRGTASYYGDKFEGRKTASGEIYEHSKKTAAHRGFPFGTALKVTNLGNGKSTFVIINDRGPFSGGRIIDLSRSAAEEIDMIRQGLAEVEITVVK